MKRSLTLFALMALASCSNNSTPASNNNTNTGTAINGGAYAQLSDNLQILSHIKGSVTSYGGSGNIESVDEFDRDFQGMFGTQEVRQGLIGRPVSWLDSNSQEQPTIALIGSTGDTGEVYGFNSFYKGPSQMAIILPHNVTIGQTWEPCVAEEPIQCLLTLKQRMDNFTSSGGTTYSDVLQVHVTYFDSSGYALPSAYDFNKTSGTANLYFARGVGIVEGDIINYEEFAGYILNGKVFEKAHKSAVGTIWRKN